MSCDLHLHTTASDGHLSAEEIVSAALAAGLDTIAITDHDSTAAVAAAIRAAEGSSLTVIPGVELSAAHDGRDVHILGYFVDPDDAGLTSRLASLRAARLERARAMVDALGAAGYSVTLDEVLTLAGGGSVGRSHVARALVSRGHAESVAHAFESLIGRDRPFYVAKPVTTPSEVVRFVRQAGAVPVLAHPGVTRIDDLIEDLTAAGLLGIEAYHAEHSEEERERYAAIARDSGLIVTGGSDFHGPTSPGVALGAVTLPDGIVDSLFDAAGRKRPDVGPASGGTSIG